MNKKILITIVVVSVLLVCVIVPVLARVLISSYQYCREVSSWGALDCSIMLELGDYYDENRKYPDSLEGLNLVFEDGATPDMLDQLQYQANGTSCRYSYSRHAGKWWNTDTKTLVEIEFSDGDHSYKATTPLR
jgi:hypothetical protein